MASIDELQNRVRSMMHSGYDLTRVETDIIDRSTLDDEERAALWLYAWALDARRRAHRERFRRAPKVTGTD